MLHLQPIRPGLDRLYLLFLLAIALASWQQQCGAMDIDSERKMVGIRIRKQGELCYPDDATMRCDNGLSCACYTCMNCEDTDGQLSMKCDMETCSDMYKYKRLQHRFLPWLNRVRWQALQQKLLESRYED